MAGSSGAGPETPAPSRPAHARLVVRSGQRAGFEYALSGAEPVVIGRDPSASIQVLDELMSRSHTRVELCGDTYYVLDLKSSNGTFVNGRRVERAPLKTGDSILLGKTRLEFVGPGDVPEREEPSGEVQLVDDPPTAGSSSVIKRVALGDLRRGGTDAAARAADRALETIYEVGNLIGAESDLDRVLDAIMDAVVAQFKVERAVLFLGPTSDALTPQVVRVPDASGSQGQQEGTRVSRTVVSQCHGEGVSILSSDAMLDDRFRGGDSILLQRIRSIMCVPLLSRDAILGVIYVDHRGVGAAFQERDLELLAAIGKQAGVAIARARLHEETKRKFESAVRVLTSVAEGHSPSSAGHSERVALVAERLARTLGLEEEMVAAARLCSLLHDIGKLQVERSILLRAGDLSEAEAAQLARHPVLGAEIVASIHPDLAAVAEGVRHHHEAYDGSGYPEGLQGEAIPVLGRLVGLANGFDVLTSGRYGLDRLTPADCAEELRRGSGQQFDPMMVQALVRLIEAGVLPGMAEEVAER